MPWTRFPHQHLQTPAGPGTSAARAALQGVPTAWILTCLRGLESVDELGNGPAKFLTDWLLSLISVKLAWYYTQLFGSTNHWLVAIVVFNNA